MMLSLGLCAYRIAERRKEGRAGKATTAKARGKATTAKAPAVKVRLRKEDGALNGTKTPGRNAIKAEPIIYIVISYVPEKERNIQRAAEVFFGCFHDRLH